MHYDISDYILEYDIGDREDFSVLQLTDIHLANKDDRALHFAFMEKTILDASPDMIVATGDLFTFADKTTARELIDFLDGFGVPWTVAFGNHDEQCYFSIEWLTGYLNTYGKNCLFCDLQDDDVFGNCNFAINLTKNGDLYRQIIIMDSNRYYFGEYWGYDYIKESQVNWYRDLVSYTTEQNGGEPVDSLLYFHIPLPEWKDAEEAVSTGSPDARVVRGTRNETACPPKYNSGLFDAVLQGGSTRAISVGHDHENDEILCYRGIYLVYGIHSTNRIYYRDGMLGGRLLTVYADGTIGFSDILHSYSEVRK